MDLNKMSAESLKEMKAQVEEAIDAKEAENDCELRLNSETNGTLYVFFIQNNDKYYLGSISPKGECSFLSNNTRIKAYEMWRSAGMKIDSSKKVQWRGGVYYLNGANCLKRDDIIDGCIYNFKDCSAMNNCKDENIVRWEHNGKPILF